ncbi:zinc-dependent metalloprotease family protein [Nocardioides sp.]|uniref:zinc-dependent metalloprotease family protein n=1 Tax=Nocardioides sp. TaxID=35761 RepID=UPI003518D22B
MARRLVPALVLAATALVPLSRGADAVPPVVVPIDVEGEALCTELVPHAVALELSPVDLDVRVLLDGAPRRVARQAVAAMRRAYAPLNITVTATYETVDFRTRSAPALNAAAKRLYGGRRPAGVDVVYTMTTKDITGGPPTGSNVAGLADCIGGIRFADRAFAVGEVIRPGGGLLASLGIRLPVSDATGKTMAHEIGHLLGGHHHLASPEGLLAADPNVTTLMGPTLSIIALRFSTLNGRFVAAHAQLYARGTD